MEHLASWTARTTVVMQSMASESECLKGSYGTDRHSMDLKTQNIILKIPYNLIFIVLHDHILVFQQ
jgi:hypothetical protein